MLRYGFLLVLIFRGLDIQGCIWTSLLKSLLEKGDDYCAESLAHCHQILGYHSVLDSSTYTYEANPICLEYSQCKHG